MCIFPSLLSPNGGVLVYIYIRILCGYWDMGTGKHKKYHKICEIYTYINIRYVFAHVFPMFATSPSTIMEAAFARLHNNGGAAEDYGGWGSGKHRKTYANMYRIFMYGLSRRFYDISYLFQYPCPSTHIGSLEISGSPILWRHRSVCH